MTTEQAVMMRAVADVVKRRLSVPSRQGTNLIMPKPNVKVTVDVAAVEAAIKEQAAITKQLVAELENQVGVSKRIAEALEANAAAMTALAQAILEQKPPVVNVPEIKVNVPKPEVTVNVPKSEAAKREPRKATIRHSDGTTATVEME